MAEMNDENKLGSQLYGVFAVLLMIACAPVYIVIFPFRLLGCVVSYGFDRVVDTWVAQTWPRHFDEWFPEFCRKG